MGKKGIQIPVKESYEENIEYLKQELRVGKSFDIIHRRIDYAGHKMSMFLVDGFAQANILLLIMKEIEKRKPEEFKDDPINELVRTFIPHVEVVTSPDLEEVIAQVLAGQTALVVEQGSKVVLIDSREYPIRSPQEPDIERVVRGPRDGFVETIVFNLALIRRRVRDRSLVMEYVQVGNRSKTDVALVYIDSIVDMENVKMLRDKLEDISIDGVSMGEKTVEEFVFGRNYNPYPLVRYTERADTSAVHLMEGHVLIVVDGSPSVMICPATYWHHLQHAEEYRQKPLVGAFLRFARFIAVAASLFLLPIWYTYATNEQLLSERWKFIGVKDHGEIALIWQFLIAEIGIEILRMAAIHTPNALATALGIVSAIIIGDVAVQVGIFTHEVVLYVAVAAIGTFATPSYELSLANRIFRVFFLIMVAILQVPGLIIGMTLWILLLVVTKTMNIPYLYPFIPFNPLDFKLVLLRSPVPYSNMRGNMLNPQDRSRQDND
ncbi:spore germination protein [Neobacillus drentensis]|uniref:spore germination protein n=1 Tax=Neobacillus drentensis TaxID=220684 RepID=UPI001F43E905|nr:spore germination protein [Neobacillus drentensis]ULT57384.1 spore germination protein [Neobacillus drentensis]